MTSTACWNCAANGCAVANEFRHLGPNLPEVGKMQLANFKLVISHTRLPVDNFLTAITSRRIAFRFGIKCHLREMHKKTKSNLPGLSSFHVNLSIYLHNEHSIIGGDLSSFKLLCKHNSRRYRGNYLQYRCSFFLIEFFMHAGVR